MVGALLAGLASPGAAPAADLPAQGVGPVTDGRGLIAVTSTDGSSITVVDVRTASVVSTALPTEAAGRRLGPTVLGIVDGHVLLVLRDITESYSGTGTPPERYALVDVAGGGFRWICGQQDDPIAGDVSLCPSVGAADGSYRGYGSFAAGRYWIRMSYPGPHGRSSAVRWGIHPDGSFWWRVPTKREDAKVLSGDHLDLDHASPRPEAPFGLRIRESRLTDDRQIVYAVRRTGDAGRSQLRLGGGDAAKRNVSIGSRGACFARDGQLVVLDRKSRRVWRRPAPSLAHGRYGGVTCAGSVVLTSAGGALDWSLRWPEVGQPNGWTPSGMLRPRATLTVPKA